MVTWEYLPLYLHQYLVQCLPQPYLWQTGFPTWACPQPLRPCSHFHLHHQQSPRPSPPWIPLSQGPHPLLHVPLMRWLQLPLHWLMMMRVQQRA